MGCHNLNCIHVDQDMASFQARAEWNIHVPLQARNSSRSWSGISITKKNSLQAQWTPDSWVVAALSTLCTARMPIPAWLRDSPKLRKFCAGRWNYTPTVLLRVIGERAGHGNRHIPPVKLGEEAFLLKCISIYNHPRYTATNRGEKRWRYIGVRL
jgi:hypothetical protein